ncbi:Valine--pyruvate aminotransferase [Rubripirellula lacrimiformis]|uniref:Valine--pyruvate aminotransferase n=1 Tax=Rubripirellula lacrimiformis TaxID=1930273 RepID=A0A517N6S7_9BACT|nr:valine--pyruvate transaminase [Rubripirellula lacrimiformis]QDT02854.1 Valine--pyruvate aminotransferase [Rubripirellula lacrimiformis]
MAWELSEFGQRLGLGSGIGELMDDLGHAIAKGGDRVCMLGGGQPAHIPQVEEVWRRRIQEIADQPGALEHALGNYEPPAGNPGFREAIAGLFRRQFGWDISSENVAVTPGGQTAFFLLLNALAGRFADGRHKKVLLPLVPEYIGYANQSVADDLFVAVRPLIDRLGKHRFKYRVDFDRLVVTDDIAAICVSRPTNPSGNVLTDDEIDRLAKIANQHQIPLIIDGAYGAPFPNVIFTDAAPVWNKDLILTLSLSKIGLPGTRTGIVIAQNDLIRSIASMTSIVGLANTNVGQSIVTPLVESGEILDVSNNIVRPFYQQKSIEALQMVDDLFDDAIPYRVHQSEGALFLWIWFEDLPITSTQLYQRLKLRDVLVVPGNHFFFGDDDPSWAHRNQCIRVTFTMPKAIVHRGLQAIAEEVRTAYQGEPAAMED